MERGELPSQESADASHKTLSISLHYFSRPAKQNVIPLCGTCCAGRWNVLHRPTEHVPSARESRISDPRDARRQKTSNFFTLIIRHFTTHRHPKPTKNPLEKGQKGAFFEGIGNVPQSVKLPISGQSVKDYSCRSITRPPDGRQPPASRSCRWGRPLRPKCPWARRQRAAVSSCPSSARSP